MNLMDTILTLDSRNRNASERTLIRRDYPENRQRNPIRIIKSIYFVCVIISQGWPGKDFLKRCPKEVFLNPLGMCRRIRLSRWISNKKRIIRHRPDKKNDLCQSRRIIEKYIIPKRLFLNCHNYRTFKAMERLEISLKRYWKGAIWGV